MHYAYATGDDLLFCSQQCRDAFYNKESTFPMRESDAYPMPEEFAAIISECAQILRSKGDDYTEGNRETDPLYNFKTLAKELGLTPEQVWAVYWRKHVSAILNFAKGGRVESEPIRERIKDAINYLLLFSLMVQGKSSEGRPFHKPEATYAEILKGEK